MSELQVYRASAGAGKTFQLTVEYLKIALQSEYAYKNILGVTFTNKATSEMKGRVLSELFKLSKGEQTAYLEVLLADKSLNLSAEQIRLRSHTTLRRLLHDFSRFSISTIDSFFQRVIKAFNKELGINENFQIELDSDATLDEAVDQVILSIDNDKELFSWIVRFTENNIEDGNNWSVRGEIRSLAGEILKDIFRDNADELFEKTKQKGILQEYLKTLQAIVSKFYNQVNEIGTAGEKALADANLTPADFAGKSRSVVSNFKKMATEPFTNKTATIQNCADDYTKLLGKHSPAEAEVIAPLLSKLFHNYLALLEREESRMLSANLILKNIYTLGILIHVQERVQHISRDNSMNLLSESGKLLQQIIDNSDTPFIYERTGVYYKHFMIDEFQDTSALQWSNFRPLLGHSLAEGNLAMLVGDVKQAIYRWRGGDWQLLENQVGEDFKFEGVQIHQLEQNWRSSGEIIRYNNCIFQLAPQLLQLQFNNQLADAGIHPDDYKNQIHQIYATGLQHIGQTKLVKSGYVQMRFLPTKFCDGLQEERTTLILEELIEHIKDIQDRGAKASEIAVLVRKGREAVLVANYLLEQKLLLGENSSYNLSILSSDSLLVSNSPAVCFLISLLRLINNHKDQVTASYANHQFYGIIEPTLQEKGITINWNNVYEKNKDFSNYQSSHTELTDQFENLNVESNSFYAFLQSDFMQKELGSRNLQEIVFKLADFFHLFDWSSELSYMQGFIDSVSEFQKRKISDLNSFLEYWDEKGKNKTISASETLDAIRIQTIHKSKGLEYKFVLIPFCDWALTTASARQNPIVWCKPKEEPFNQLNIVPVKYSKDMSNSIFKNEYFQEMQNMYIEALNMLYVAFTRTRTELYTWSTYNENLFDAKKDNEIKTTGDLLKMVLENEATYSYDNKEEMCCKLHAGYHNDKELFESGSKATFTGNNEAQASGLEITSFSFQDFDDYLKLRKNHENFFTQDSKQEQSVNRGKVIHEALAQIRTKDELPKALQILHHKGLFPKDEMDTYTQQITNMLDDPEVTHWFDGSYKILNERSILLGNTQGIRRPDRIMIKGTQAIVVDYKSGEYEIEKYHKQVAEYMVQLQECGFESVTGYLWYTKNNKRVAVNFQQQKNHRKL